MVLFFSVVVFILVVFFYRLENGNSRSLLYWNDEFLNRYSMQDSVFENKDIENK